MYARIIFLTVLCSLGASTAIAESVVTTAPLPGGTRNAVSFECSVVNTGTKPKTVTIEIVNANTGTVTASAGPAPVDPGKGAVATSATITTQYCRVTGLPRKAVGIIYYARDALVNVLASTTVP